MSAQEYEKLQREKGQYRYWGEVFHRQGNIHRRNEMFAKHDEIVLRQERARMVGVE